jgi:hypothetical protein
MVDEDPKGSSLADRIEAFCEEAGAEEPNGSLGAVALAEDTVGMGTKGLSPNISKAPAVLFVDVARLSKS